MARTILVLLTLTLLAGFLAGAAHAISQRQVLFGVLLGSGAIGFFAAPALPVLGPLLRHVELPASFQTATIATPDGRRFAATTPLSRVQRYDAAGRFETGWFVDSGGGLIAIGLTLDGRIAVAAGRTRRVELFNPDGSSAGAPRPFTKSDKGLMGDYLRPYEYDVEGVWLAYPVPAANPSMRLNTFVLFPLWHPVIAWLLMAAGMIGLGVQERLRRKGREPTPTSSS